MGRPRKLTVDQIEKHLEEFLKENKTPSITGFCMKLGIDRQTLWDWKKETNGYSYIAKKVLHAFESLHEANLFNSKSGASTGSIFWLKCHGWQDGNSQAAKIAVASTPDGGHKVTVNWNVMPAANFEV